MSNMQMSKRDMIRDIVSCNRNGLAVIRFAYKESYYVHIAMLVYHALYGMDVNVDEFMEARDKRTSILSKFREIDEDKLTEMKLSAEELKTYMQEARQCYFHALNVINEYAVDEMEKLHKYEDEHDLPHFEHNQEFIQMNVQKINDPAHIRFMNENADVLEEEYKGI